MIGEVARRETLVFEEMVPNLIDEWVKKGGISMSLLLILQFNRNIKIRGQHALLTWNSSRQQYCVFALVSRLKN